MREINVLGVSFLNESIQEAVEHGMVAMDEHKCAYAVAPDSEMLLEAKKNRRLMAAIDKAALVLPEGNGIICASHILGMPIEHRICAIDFASALMARMSEKGMSVFILGTDTDIVEPAADNIRARYPGLRIVGSDDGYYTMDSDIIDAVNEAKPDLLLVAYGMPKQEIWMYRNRDALDAGLMLGFEGGLKMLAGVTKRAPKRWRDSGFEWLYRLVKEPWRLVRMLRQSQVVFTALWRRAFGN